MYKSNSITIISSCCGWLCLCLVSQHGLLSILDLHVECQVASGLVSMEGWISRAKGCFNVFKISLGKDRPRQIGLNHGLKQLRNLTIVGPFVMS
jgi:hypothetical protein